MRTVLFASFLLISLFVKAQSKPALEPAAMREDFAYLRHHLEATHPMLYIHHTPEAMKAIMDSLAATIDKPLPFFEFYKKIAYLIAQVGCEHTSCGYGEGFDKLMRSASFFPFQLYFLPDKVHILINLTLDKDIRPGDELLSLNNYPIDSIRKVLYQYIPADGHITEAKDNQLSAMAFNIWYYLFVEQAREFKIVVRTREGKLISKTVDALTLKKLNEQAGKNPVNKPVLDLDKRLQTWRKEPLHLELLPENKAAVLSVLTFYTDMNRFRSKLDSFFKVMAANKTEKLIIELANNGGGEVELAADLLNYFITAPTSIVEYSYLLTDSDEYLKLASIPDEIRQSKYDYIEPLKDGRSYAKLSKYAGELKMLQPRADRFTGKVYLFVNGGTSSAASTFAAVMKSLGLATVVGQETIGTYAGGGTVIGLDLTLPNSKITAHTGLLYQRFRTTGGEPHRGVIPDVPYVVSFDELFAADKPWRRFILELK
ncbi:MAG: S41 family peptidase [Chitinophagaceae bacterium]